ncbi:hypothetical protein QEN19_003707 [Hanseniaspora menglaensis]
MANRKYESLPNHNTDFKKETNSQGYLKPKTWLSKKIIIFFLGIVVVIVFYLAYHIWWLNNFFYQNSQKQNKNEISFHLDNVIVENDCDGYRNVLSLASIPQEGNTFRVSSYFNSREVLVPDMSDKNTIRSLAQMAQNAYVRNPHSGDWENVTDADSHYSFGWDDDYVRGHVFKNKERKLIIISYKGTSSTGLPGSGSEKDTIENDKVNDNLLFSCCCARVTYLWTPVCDCYVDSFTCNQNCLEENIRDKSYYFKSSCEIYKTVSNKYPGYTIWTVGHSLGGSLSSLVARTYGLVGVAFEAPGELLASQRLHLPLPNEPSFDTIWHVGNNADPIYMGTCNGASSSCNLAGYAMESRCHSGWEITYDTIGELNWGVDVRKHRIKTVIYQVIDKMEVPIPEFTGNGKGENACIDCYDWEFVNGTPTTSLYSSTATTTSTTTQRTTTTLTTTLSSSCVGRNFVGWCTSYTTI